jgi:hypothetical protein
VVAIGFGDGCHAMEEIEAGHEILNGPILSNPLSVVGEIPAVQTLENGASFI